MKESDYLSELSEEQRKIYEASLQLIEAGRLKKAEKKLKSLLAEKINFIPALNKKAVIFIYRKKIKKAQRILNKILQKDPNYAPALTNLGSIAKELDNSQRAKNLYHKAVEIDEDYGPAYNNLGVIYREEGNYSESVKYLKKAKKKGSISYDLSSDKSLLKNPGCILLIFLAVIIFIILYFILK